MSNFLLAANYLINTLLGLYMGAVLVRFLLARQRADFSSPLAQLVVKLTNPVLWPLRRVIPPIGRLDLASLVLLAVLGAANIGIDLGLLGHGTTLLALAWLTLLRLATVVLGTFTVTIVLEALMSWTGQGGYNPVARAFATLNAPLLKPLRRLIPPVANIDLTPLFALIALQALAFFVPLDAWFR